MLSKIQLGKNGVTDNFISTLKSHFEKHRDVRIQVLKSAREEKTTKEYEQEILKKMGRHFTSRTIGFVIKMKRWRREQGEE